MVFYLITLFVFVLGIIFTAVGVCTSKSEKRKEAECTSKVDGVIVDIRRERIGSGTGVNNTRTYSYFPVYQYYTGEHTLTRKSNKGFTKGKYKIGQTVPVYYNPSHPEDCYVPEFSIKAAGTVFIVLGICFMAFAGSVLLKIVIDILARYFS